MSEKPASAIRTSEPVAVVEREHRVHELGVREPTPILLKMLLT
jgi:hypothetical protein